jgi:hypothetical protein
MTKLKKLTYNWDLILTAIAFGTLALALWRFVVYVYGK